MKPILSISVLILFVNSFISAQAIERNSNIVKVLTFNILHGQTMNKDFNLDVIANVILKTDPDFVAMQEVDFKTNRALKYDLATELGWRTKMVPLFARAMPYDDGEYGEAILSKYSIIQSRNVSLPHSPGKEPRAALEITVVIPSGDTLNFIGTHLDHTRDETDRIAQAKEINHAFLNNPYPSILAGDLNALPESFTMNILRAWWTMADSNSPPAPTFPSSNPGKKIDYVLYYPANKWKVLNTEVIQDTIASDHCAFLATLELLQKDN